MVLGMNIPLRGIRGKRHKPSKTDTYRVYGVYRVTKGIKRKEGICEEEE